MSSLQTDPQASRASDLASMAPQPTHSDEIDLISLVQSLWGEKLLISLVTAICIGLGLTYALTAKEQWTATATVIAPTSSDLEQLNRLKGRIAASGLEIGTPDPYSRFLTLFNSADNKLQFAREHPLTSGEFTVPDDPLATRRRMQGFIDGIGAAKPKNEEHYVLKLASDRSPKAAELLEAYYEHTTQRVTDEIREELASNLEVSIDTLESKVEYIRTATLESLAFETGQTQFASEIASAAAIEEPFENRYSSDNFPIHLGTKALEKKREILGKIKDPAQLNKNIGQLETQLAYLRTIQVDGVVFLPARLLQSIEPPLKRDKPKRALIMVLAAAAGGMLGCLVALVRIQLRARRGTPAAAA